MRTIDAHLGSLVTAVALIVLCATPRAEAVLFVSDCVGDCQNERQVDVSDLLIGVNIALGLAPLNICLALDADQSGSVEINELLTAVGNALNGCPPPVSPTPSPKRQTTPTVTGHTHIDTFRSADNTVYLLLSVSTSDAGFSYMTPTHTVRVTSLAISSDNIVSFNEHPQPPDRVATSVSGTTGALIGPESVMRTRMLVVHGTGAAFDPQDENGAGVRAARTRQCNCFCFESLWRA